MHDQSHQDTTEGGGKKKKNRHLSIFVTENGSRNEKQKTKRPAGRVGWEKREKGGGKGRFYDIRAGVRSGVYPGKVKSRKIRKPSCVTVYGKERGHRVVGRGGDFERKKGRRKKPFGYTIGHGEAEDAKEGQGERLRKT